MLFDQQWKIPFRMVFFLVFLLLTPASLMSARTVTAGVYENRPKIFINEKGQPSGIFVDILTTIAAAEGWTLQFISGTWEESLKRLEAGNLDLMPDVAWTAERSERYLFNQVPVLSSWSQVYARKASHIHSIIDLDRKRVSVLKGSIQETSFSQLADGFGLNITIIPVDCYSQAFQNTSEGKADAAIANNFFGLMNADDYHLEDTAVIFNPSALYFAASRHGDKEILDRIDYHLRIMKEDHNSIFYKSLKFWTSEEIQFRLPFWIRVSGLFIGGLLVLSITGGLLLKHQVNARTRDLQQQNEQLVILDRTLRQTISHLNLQHTLNATLNSVLELTGFEGGAIFMRDPESGQFFEGASINTSGLIISTADKPEIQILENSYSGHDPVILWDKQCNSDSVSRTIECSKGLRHYTAFRIHLRNDCIGVLYVYTEKEEELSKSKLILIQDICATVALALENARLYEQEKNYAKDLEQQVADRTAELADAMQKAQAADRIKSAFLATMSHELRTPLNSIIGFTGIMLQGLAGPLNSEQQKQMSMVQNSSRHLLALINDVLDISKIEAGQLELSNSQFNLNDSVEKMVKLVSPLAEKKRLRVVNKMESDDMAVYSDKLRFEQIILNLLNNAIKFTDEGEVTIKGRRTGDMYEISVSDTGIGINSDKLNELFQPFHQIDTGLARKHEGTGLGLSICRKLLDLMSGSISLESQFGLGSTFTITLPVTSGGENEKMQTANH